MKNLLIVFLSALVSVMAPPLWANSSALVELLEPLVNGAGEFEQVTYDSKGQAVQRSNGQFAVMKPGKFYWQTTQPYEQLLVSDANTIWLYDPDLEQVTIKPFSNEQNQLPVRILSGEFDLLHKEFRISQRQQGQQTVFHLAPKSTAGSVAAIDLTFSGQNLESMAVTDKTDTKTEFVFTGRKALSQEDKKRFSFEIPEGADVFHDQPL